MTHTASALVEQGRRLAGEGKVNEAVDRFEAALALDPSLELEAEQEAKGLAAPALVEQGRRLAGEGKVNEAVDRFEAALVLDPLVGIEPILEANLYHGLGLLNRRAYTESMTALDSALGISPTLDITSTLTAWDWNNLCWNGTLAGAAAQMMPACERVAALDPDDGNFRNSRGLARALTGDIEGSITDFEFAIQWASDTGYDATFIESRQAWIEALRADDNPFDEATLEALRNE